MVIDLGRFEQESVATASHFGEGGDGRVVASRNRLVDRD